MFYSIFFTIQAKKEACYEGWKRDFIYFCTFIEKTK